MFIATVVVPPTVAIAEPMANYQLNKGDCSGKDIAKKQFKFTDVEKCAGECDSTTGCVGFVWAPKLATSCFLKHAKCGSLKAVPNIDTYYKTGM